MLIPQISQSTDTARAIARYDRLSLRLMAWEVGAMHIYIPPQGGVAILREDEPVPPGFRRATPSQARTLAAHLAAVIAAPFN